MQRFDNSSIRKCSKKCGIPVVELVMKFLKQRYAEEGKRATIFAACPNSEAVLKASIMAAKKANAPIKFAATLNQVDLDGGYTKWTQETFVSLVARTAEELEFTGPIIIALDHGGPWLKDLHSRDKWTLEETMMAVKTSFTVSLFAGYDLIHVDPTVDKTLKPGSTIDIDVVVKRTLELITYLEGVRRRNNLPKISYETGTEEVHGGLADIKVFSRFLNGLKKGLAESGLGEVWPVYIVGKVGTDLDTSVFDPDVARHLVETAAGFGSFIKGHYTDYVENPEEYPLTGIGAANIGPEFTEEEYKGLMQLVDMEEKLYKEGKIGCLSMFKSVLWDAVICSGRWTKWRKPDETGMEFGSLSVERQEWLVKTGCRYIWTNDGVVSARKVLYSNLAKNGIDAEAVVLKRIEDAIMKYYKAFELVNINDYLNKEAEKLMQLGQ